MGADEMRFQLAQTIERDVRGFFSFFSLRKEKNTFLLYQRRRICRFLTDEKTTKRVVEAIASNSHPSAGKHIPTARRCCSARKARTGHHSPCEKFVRLETPRPQAQTAGLHSPSVRRVPPWIARVYRVQTRAGSRRDAFSARTNGQAGGLQFF